MNSYIPRSPEQGRRFTPQSVTRRLSVTYMSARLVMSATGNIEDSESAVREQAKPVPVANNVINFPVAKAAGVNTTSGQLEPKPKYVEQNSSNLKTPEYFIPEQNNTEAVQGNVVDMNKYRMVQDAQQKLEDIYGAA